MEDKHTVTLDVKGLHNTVSIDRVALALEAQRMSEANTLAGSPIEIDNQPSIDDKGNLREYVVDKIVAYRKENGKSL